MWQYVIKILLTAAVVVAVAEIAKRRDFLGRRPGVTPAYLSADVRMAMNRDGRRRMRRIVLVVAIISLVAAADAETLLGELSFNSQGTGRVLECKSGRVLTLGEMTSNQYRRLIDGYWRLSFYGKTPVLVEVRGAVTRKGPPGTELTLESPNVVRLNSGRCADGRY
jgi:hypothetical protein